MQLVRRIPKRGFNYPFKNEYQVLNVEGLNKFENNSVVGPAELKRAGLVGSEKAPIKILGDGKLTKKLTVKVHKASKSAKKKIDEAGSKIEILKA